MQSELHQYLMRSFRTVVERAKARGVKLPDQSREELIAAMAVRSLTGAGVPKRTLTNVS